MTDNGKMQKWSIELIATFRHRWWWLRDAYRLRIGETVGEQFFLLIDR